MYIDWGTFFLSVPTTLIIAAAAAKFIAKAYIQQLFSKELESHKHELQLITEYNKFDIQRKMQDFNLFTIKKHESYAKLYDLYLRADGRVRGLYNIGLTSNKNFEEYSKEDIESYLKGKNILQSKVVYFANQWDQGNKVELIKELKSFLKQINTQEAKREYQVAQNEYLLNRLYLGDAVVETIEKINKEFNSVVTTLEFLPDVRMENRNELEITIKNLLKELTIRMKDDLKIGYYNKN